MKSIKRRNFIKTAVLGSLASVFATKTHANMVTPTDAQGPFYPITPQKDKDADLTHVKGRSGTAKGQIIEIYGQVLDQDMNPIEDVTIDLWQANTFGKYHHPHDDSEAPIDENFQSWAILQSGKHGKFRFKTVMPGAYPLHSSDQRTPHIHFKVTKYGYESLLTQLYFPDQALNKTDGLYNRKNKDQQALMTAKKTKMDNVLHYDIILAKV
ncbi:hypothetical protein KO527_02880 [Pseudoalteromonas sp. C2R02]|uniref:dioxygenase family protein n=1 Tax=Pseudoalteromonas sp. C2R02 TaxID=2841565 RepID=UPI001C0969FD|nr:protocatechuate 3,4-dioxygenase [Pseudoalteromonas sp. C2R02]MBU2968300.1 hypothetical protein [Pseudoalteromonas sp. C2R02]